MNNKAMFKLTYGLFVLSCFSKGKHNGCIINTAAQVTSSPNRISIAVNKANLTHDIIAETGLFNISVISEDATFKLFERFNIIHKSILHKLTFSSVQFQSNSPTVFFFFFS